VGAGAGGGGGKDFKGLVTFHFIMLIGYHQE